MSHLQWLAGAATRPFPVPDGTPMDGYGARQEGCSGTLSPLELNLLYLHAEGEGALLVTLDLLAIDRAWVTALRCRLARQFGLKPSAVLVAASHTHAGPGGFRRLGAQHPMESSLRRRLRRRVLELAVEAAEEAVQGAGPAVVTTANRPVGGVAANRISPEGPADLTLTAITVRRPSGEPLAVLWHYACHPTVLSAANTLLSADLPGEVRQSLRRKWGSRLPVLYLNGAAADLSTRFTRQGSGQGELARLGGLLANAFPAAGEALLPSAPAGIFRTVVLPASPPPDPAEAEARLADAEARLSALQAAGAPAPEVRLAEVEVMGARKRNGRVLSPGPSVLRATVQLLRLGDLALVAVPGELYAEQGMAMVAAGPQGLRRLVIGYAGDYLGYLPAAAHRSGYEADSALVAPGAGERLVAAVAQLWKESTT